MMEHLTGSSSSPTLSSRERLFFGAATPQLIELAGISLLPENHCLIPMMHKPGQSPGTHAGLEHQGIEWISAGHSPIYGGEQRLIYNAREILVMPWGHYINAAERLHEILVNDYDFMLRTPLPGILVPAAGRYFPPGSLQIIVDDCDQQILNASTTIPTPEMVPSRPCSGWCWKHHIYASEGLEERAVIFFNQLGWPVACEERLPDQSSSRRWWRFDYSRPT